VAVLPLVANSAPALAQPDNPAGVSPSDLRARRVAPTKREQGAKAFTGRVASTDPQLLKRTDSSPVAVMIKLDYDALARRLRESDTLA
jgi:hypothetical protein